MKKLFCLVVALFLSACMGNAEVRFINTFEGPLGSTIAGNINQATVYPLTSSSFYEIGSGEQFVELHSDRLTQTFDAGKKYSVFRQYDRSASTFEIFAIEDAPETATSGMVSVYNLNKDREIVINNGGSQSLKIAPRSMALLAKSGVVQISEAGGENSSNVDLSQTSPDQTIVTISHGKALIIKSAGL